MDIKFFKPFKSKDGTTVKSKYSPDGKFAKTLPACGTIGELKALLAQLPDSLPVEAGFGQRVLPVWYNVGDATEHLEFEEEDDDGDEESE